MVGISVLISVYSESRNNRTLIGDIRQFRAHLREHHKDLRMNTDVWRTIWNYIDNLEQLRGAMDGSTIDRTAQQPTPAVTPAAVEIEEHDEEEERTVPVSPKPPVAKRGRPTMRTKHPKILPQALSAKSKSKPMATLENERQCKRPRTGPSPLFVPEGPVTVSPSPSPSSAGPPVNVVAAAIPAADRAISPQDIQQMVRDEVQRTLAQRSQSANPASPSLNTNQGPFFQSGMAPAAGITDTRQINSPGAPSQPPPTPFQAREQHISTLNGYRAPQAPMGNYGPAQSSAAPSALPYHASGPQTAQDWFGTHPQAFFPASNSSG